MLSPLFFIMVIETLFRENRGGCSEELFYADDFALISESLDGLKGRLESWKGPLETKELRVNV